MWSEPPHTPERSSTPSLVFSRLPPEPPWMPTPPRLTLASVPFLWEEAPGKPRPFAGSEIPWLSPPLGDLPPPPRLLNEAIQSTLLSPTTVLDGPERAYGSKRWGSFRMCKELVGGGNDSLATVVDGGGGGSGRFGKKITPSLSVSSYGRSHFLVKIYEKFKRVFPWRRRRR